MYLKPIDPFDTIDHELLLLKLTRYGFSSLSIHLIRSYLSNRFSITTFDGAQFKPKALKVGGPQVSVLGPFCFKLFLNQLVSKYGCTTLEV
jgi:hypothetical protein